MSDVALFVGYRTIEEWMQSVDKKRPVFSCLVREPSATNANGMRTDKLVVIASQPEQGQALVHSFRTVGAILHYVYDEPFDSDREHREDIAEQLWRLIETWLEEQGLTLQHGVIATPENLRLLEGFAGFIHFDGLKREYYRGDVKEQSDQNK